MRKVSIKNSNGKNIAAVLDESSEPTNKLAILCPGFLDTKDYLHLKELAARLAQKRFTVVRFDPTGTWESEGDISEYIATQYLEDIKSVLEHMLNDHQFEFILLGGHSRGGRMSISYAARDRRISHVLGIMPSSGRMGGRRRAEWEKTGISVAWRDIPGKADEKKKFSVPFSHVLDLDKLDTLADIKKIHVPVVLVAGALDISVPLKTVQRLFDAANEPKKYLLLKGIDHEYRHRNDEIDLVNDQILQTLGL